MIAQNGTCRPRFSVTDLTQEKAYVLCYHTFMIGRLSAGSGRGGGDCRCPSTCTAGNELRGVPPLICAECSRNCWPCKAPMQILFGRYYGTIPTFYSLELLRVYKYFFFFYFFMHLREPSSVWMVILSPRIASLQVQTWHRDMLFQGNKRGWYQ